MLKRIDKKLGDLELQILNIIWEQGPSTVRQVLEALKAEPKPVYTTVLTMMRLMEEKGYLSRQGRGRAHVYSARLQEKSIKKGLLQKFINNAFRGSSEELVLHLLEDKNLSKEELERIRSLILKNRG